MRLAERWGRWGAVGLVLAVCAVCLGLSSGVTGLGGRFVKAWVGGAFGSPSSLAMTLELTGVLVLVGLAFLVPFRGGLFNIGAEGQLYVGGLVAALVGIYLAVPGGIHPVVALLAGALAGAGWAAVAGILKCWRGAHEVVSTIMLNHIAIKMSQYLVDGPLNAGAYTARTRAVAESAHLPLLWQVRPTAVDAGVLVALALVAVVALGLRRTVWGYELRVVGGNPRAAAEAGISLGWVRFGALALGGAMAGLAGGVLVLGMEHVFTATLSPGFGYDGIAVALLAGGRSWAVPLSALFLGSLRTAGNALQLEARLSPRVIYVVEAALILVVAARGRLGLRFRRGRAPAGERV